MSLGLFYGRRVLKKPGGALFAFGWDEGLFGAGLVCFQHGHPSSSGARRRSISPGFPLRILMGVRSSPKSASLNPRTCVDLAGCKRCIAQAPQSLRNSTNAALRSMVSVVLCFLCGTASPESRIDVWCLGKWKESCQFPAKQPQTANHKHVGDVLEEV